MKQNILLFAFLNLSFNICFSQNDVKKLEQEINIEMHSKFKSLKEKVNEQTMNPFMKNVYYEFAVDTFQIEYLKRKMLLKLNIPEHLKHIKNDTHKYEKLISKYFELLKKECDESEKARLIISQTAWEDFKNKELIWLIKMLKGSPLDINYYSEYCDIIKQRVLYLFFYYCDLKVN